MSNLTVKIRFYDEDDKQAFLRYVEKAQQQEGTVTGVYAGIMCSALKHSTIKPEVKP